MRLGPAAPRLEREMAWDSEPLRVLSVHALNVSHAGTHLRFVLRNRRTAVDVLILKRCRLEALFQRLHVRHGCYCRMNVTRSVSISASDGASAGRWTVESEAVGGEKSLLLLLSPQTNRSSLATPIAAKTRYQTQLEIYSRSHSFASNIFAVNGKRRQTWRATLPTPAPLACNAACRRTAPGPSALASSPFSKPSPSKT